MASSDAPRFAVCEPTYFDVVYRINPWMDPSVGVDTDLAARQWRVLCDALRLAGACIEVVPARPGLPDMVFVSDAGIAHGRTFARARFRHAERRGEAALVGAWFAGRGYDVVEPPDGVYIEGTADVAFWAGNALVASGPRSTPEAAPWLASVFGELRFHPPLRLVDERLYHLGAALAPLDDSTCLYAPMAFDGPSIDVVTSCFPNAIALDDDDALAFAANAVTVGRSVFVHAMSESAERALADRGFTVHRVDLSEFLKAGGAARCLVLPLLP